MLHGTEQTQRMMPVAIKGQHGVDEVFQHPGPGQPTVFGDVPNQNRSDAPSLCFAHQHMRALSHLPYASWCRRQRRIVHGLNRINHHDIGLHVTNMAKHCWQT